MSSSGEGKRYAAQQTHVARVVVQPRRLPASRNLRWHGSERLPHPRRLGKGRGRHAVWSSKEAVRREATARVREIWPRAVGEEGVCHGDLSRQVQGRRRVVIARVRSCAEGKEQQRHLRPRGRRRIMQSASTYQKNSRNGGNDNKEMTWIKIKL